MRLIVNDGMAQRPASSIQHLLDRFPSRPETGTGCRTNHLQHSSLVSMHDPPPYPGPGGATPIWKTFVPRRCRTGSVACGLRPSTKGTFGPSCTGSATGDASGIARCRTQSHGSGRGEWNQQTTETPSHPRGKGRVANPRCAGSALATLVLIALCFGLRVSEILGLRWTDFDFKRSTVPIQRWAVGKPLNKLKTEYSLNRSLREAQETSICRAS